MSSSITSTISRLLAHQDPNARHSPVTRVVVSAIIVAANAVLYGFFGVICAVAYYLIGVEVLGMSLRWFLLPVLIALVASLAPSWRMLKDYWRNYGH